MKRQMEETRLRRTVTAEKLAELKEGAPDVS